MGGFPGPAAAVHLARIRHARSDVEIVEKSEIIWKRPWWCFEVLEEFYTAVAGMKQKNLTRKGFCNFFRRWFRTEQDKDRKKTDKHPMVRKAEL